MLASGTPKNTIRPMAEVASRNASDPPSQSETGFNSGVRCKKAGPGKSATKQMEPGTICLGKVLWQETSLARRCNSDSLGTLHSGSTDKQRDNGRSLQLIQKHH